MYHVSFGNVLRVGLAGPKKMFQRILDSLMMTNYNSCMVFKIKMPNCSSVFMGWESYLLLIMCDVAKWKILAWDHVDLKKNED